VKGNTPGGAGGGHSPGMRPPKVAPRGALLLGMSHSEGITWHKNIKTILAKNSLIYKHTCQDDFTGRSQKTDPRDSKYFP
jgi:hypothetical protein